MSNRPRLLVLAVACILFFGIGLFSATGPVLPDLARNTGSSLAEVGLLFSALFAGSVAMQIMSGHLTERFGTRCVLLVGSVIMAVGVFGVTLSPSLPVAVLFMLVAGLGDGSAIVVANVLVVESFNSRRLAALNLANVFFGLGAIAGPALAAYSLQMWQTAIPAFWALSVIVLLPLPLIAIMRFPEQASKATDAGPKISLYRSPLLWLFGGLLLIYVGTEIGIGGWGASFLTLTTSLDAPAAALVLSAFWIAFTSGRLLAAFISTICPPHLLLAGALAGTLIGVLLLLLASGSSVVTIGALLLIALCLGPIFPTVVGITTVLFEESAARAAAAVIVVGSVGGLILPWLQGVLLVGFGPLVYLLFLLLCVLLMLGLYGAIRLFYTER
ncbi:MAG: MFS transporter [Chloroflexia bacterium]